MQLNCVAGLELTTQPGRQPIQARHEFKTPVLPVVIYFTALVLFCGSAEAPRQLRRYTGTDCQSVLTAARELEMRFHTSLSLQCIAVSSNIL